jgi:hypothetical protein
MTTKLRSVAIVGDSSFDGVTIGGTTPPATGNISNLQCAEFTATSSMNGPSVSQGDSSTAIVNTFWAKFGLAFSFGANGYFQLPQWLGGFMIQWGTASGLGNNTPTTVNFSPAFPTQCFGVVANDNSSFATSGNPRTMGTTVVSRSQCTILANGAGASAFFIALGN